MLNQFLLYSKVNQLYIDTHPLFFRFFSLIGYYIILSIVPCAIHQVLVGKPVFLRMALSALLSRESQERQKCSCHGLGSGESKVMTWGLLVLPSSHPATGLNSHRATLLFHTRDVQPGKCRAHGGLWEIDQLFKMFSPLFCTSNLSHPEQCFMARFNGEGARLLFSSGKRLLELRPDLSKSIVGTDTYRH